MSYATLNIAVLAVALLAIEVALARVWAAAPAELRSYSSPEGTICGLPFRLTEDIGQLRHRMAGPFRAHNKIPVRASSQCDSIG